MTKIYHLPFTIYQYGFTFIELIVVFSVIVILSSIGIASFVSYSRNQQLNSSVSDLVTVINLAKSRSSSQVKPDICSDSEMLEGYEVRICGLAGSSCISSFPIGSYGYELDVKCSSKGFPVPISNYAKQLPQSISFSGATTSTSLFFPILLGGVKGKGEIVFTGYGQTKTITIDSLGNITTQ